MRIFAILIIVTKSGSPRPLSLRGPTRFARFRCCVQAYGDFKRLNVFRDTTLYNYRDTQKCNDKCADILDIGSGRHDPRPLLFFKCRMVENPSGLLRVLQI